MKKKYFNLLVLTLLSVISIQSATAGTATKLIIGYAAYKYITRDKDKKEENKEEQYRENYKKYYRDECEDEEEFEDCEEE